MAAQRILGPEWNTVCSAWQYRQKLADAIVPETVIRTEIEHLRARTSLLSQRVNEQLADIPAALELSSIYRELENLASNHSIRLEAVVPQEIEELDAHQQLELRIQVAAQFPNMVRFMYYLEGGTRLFRIHETVIEAAGDDGTVNGTILVEARLRR